jgi:hypothetical protein
LSVYQRRDLKKEVESKGNLWNAKNVPSNSVIIVEAVGIGFGRNAVACWAREAGGGEIAASYIITTGEGGILGISNTRAAVIASERMVYGAGW